MRKPNVAFICVHNSCRSQMAEALGKKLAKEDDAFLDTLERIETKILDLKLRVREGRIG